MSVFHINYGIKKSNKIYLFFRKTNQNQFKSTGFGLVILEKK